MAGSDTSMALPDFGAALGELLAGPKSPRPSPLLTDLLDHRPASGNAPSWPEAAAPDDRHDRRELVARAIQEDDLLVVRVPVVSLPQRRRRMVAIRLECRQGGPPADPRDLLGDQADDLRAALDLETVRAAVKAAERPVAGAENLPVLVHVAATSFLREEALDALSILVGRRGAQTSALIMVLDQWPADRAGLELVALLRRAGVAIGLNLNERPHLSPDAIADRGVGLVCLAAAELHHAALGAYDGDLIQDIRGLQRRSVNVVATGIGTERTLVEALDFPIQLGTGELFGRIG